MIEPSRTYRKVFQVHPSSFCNYECIHCYSSSSPRSKESLSPELITQAIEDAADLGYETLSVSGGEPLLYPYLDKILKAAKGVGMRTSLITNGSLPEKSYSNLEGLVDVIGISLDGDKHLHNQVRKNPSAFDKVDRFLDFSDRYFRQVGIVFGLSDQSWEALPDMLRFAATKSIDLFQINALEPVGRAKRSHQLSISDDTLKKVTIFSELINQVFSFDVHLNLVQGPNDLNFQIKNEYQSIAELIDLLVLEANGDVMPLTYGLNKKWVICNLHKIRIREGLKAFVNDKYHMMYDAIENVLNVTPNTVSKPSEYLINQL